MKKVIVFLDLDGWWDKKYNKIFDIEKNTKGILALLRKFRIKAVFNVLGIVAEEYPHLIKKIYDEGHEIASKGYKHENFSQLSSAGLNSVLEKTEDAIFKIIKEKPIGIRSPWLINNKEIYSIFKNRGYKWASNSHLLLRESLEKPGAKTNFFSITNFGRLFMSLKYAVVWKKNPYVVNGILEIPLLSSYEREFLDMVCVTQNTPKIWIDYVISSLKTQYNGHKNYFNLNFCCWAIGTGNRLGILENILSYIKGEEGKFILPRDITK